MIKLLVVDDEKATRNGIVKHIDWDSLGVHEVNEAKDGLEGLEIARSFQPDIIISDIYMPGMNGIQMAYQIKDLLPSCKIIFLSGYSEKEYLKAAIHLNVVNYIEKPINLDEIKDAVEKAVNFCREEEKKTLNEKKMMAAISENLPSIKQKLVHGLIRRKVAYEESVEDLRLLGIAFDARDIYTVLIFKLSFPPDYPQDEMPETGIELLRLADDCLDDDKHICALTENHNIIAILSTYTVDRNRLQASFETIRSRIKELKIPCDNLFCAVGKSVFGFNQIRDSYQTAEAASQKLFYRGYGCAVFFEEKSEDPFCIAEGISIYFRELLQTQGVDKIIPFIDNLCREITLHQETAVDDVKNTFFKLTYILFQEAEKRGVHFKDTKDGKENYIWSQISRFQTLTELRDYLVNNMSYLFESIDEPLAAHRSIHKVLEYIQRNYASSDISNQTLAEYVCLTPAYLSALFKKETGKTISDYLIEVRVEKSKELLKRPHNKLLEVAWEVGYSDANYYTKVFKKYAGMTPSEYRKKYGSW